MKPYEFKWKEELFYAFAVFAVYIGTAFAQFEGGNVESWKTWAVGVILGATRVAVAALISPLARYIAARQQ